MDKNISSANALSANMVVNGMNAQLPHSSPKFLLATRSKNISSTNHRLVKDSKHTAKSTTNKFDFI